MVRECGHLNFERRTSLTSYHSVEAGVDIHVRATRLLARAVRGECKCQAWSPKPLSTRLTRVSVGLVVRERHGYLHLNFEWRTPLTSHHSVEAGGHIDVGATSLLARTTRGEGMLGLFVEAPLNALY